MTWISHLVLLFLLLPSKQEREYHINPSNTKIEFSAKHFGVISVKGHFSKFKGNLTLDNAQLKNAFVEIEVSSISTNNNSRDESLKNKTFLDALNYPRIRFESNNTIDSNSIMGKLSIRGTSNLASISYNLVKEAGVNKLKGECLLKREDYNLMFGSMDDLVSDEIKVFLEIVLPIN